jgi:geranylgeranyl pyrophosphate synthase
MMADQSRLENALEDLNKIRKVLSDCGALEEAKNRSRKHADSAKKLISETTMSREAKDFYISFIDYVKESLNWYK